MAVVGLGLVSNAWYAKYLDSYTRDSCPRLHRCSKVSAGEVEILGPSQYRPIHVPVSNEESYRKMQSQR
jgi:hypothetical protein